MTSFDLPRGQMFPVRAVDVRLDPGPHPFERGYEAAIAENWARERAEKPALFDGPIVLLSALRYQAERLEGRCHVVRYSTFLFWRRNRAAESAEHAFAHAALVSNDGALVAIRMGPHTVNAGRVYFAAGSFEPQDFREGRADLAFNMEREVREETGFHIAGLPFDPVFQAYSDAGGTAIFRRYRLSVTADEATRRIARFVAGDPDPEIAEGVAIRGADDVPEGLAPHMAAFSRWHFGAGREFKR